VRDDLMDILTSVHIGKRLHSQTCMLHFSPKHDIRDDEVNSPNIFIILFLHHRADDYNHMAMQGDL